MSSSNSTRRSISIRGTTYVRLAKYCEAHGVSMSSFLEEVIRADLDREGAPTPRELEPRERKPRKPKVDVKQHMEF